ncbi:MAG: PAS domain-containing protein, partial [Candidatus Binatia bacterium]
MAAAIAAFPWETTAVGPIDTWPQVLKSTLSLILRSPVPIATMWGPTGVLIYNQAYAVVAGPRHPHILGAKVTEAWPEAAAFNANVMKVVLGGEVLSYVDQEMMLNRSGTEEQVWMTLDYSPVLDENNQPIGVMGVVIETTAKVRAERYRAVEQHRLQAMFEQAPGFSAMLTGPDHVFTLANPAYTTIVNNRPVLGKPLRDALPEAVEQGFVALLDKIYVSGEVFTGSAIPFVTNATDDVPETQRYLDFVYQPLRGDDGKVFGIFVQGADVTDRVLAEQSLRASEVTFRTLAQALPNQVWAASPDGLLDWFNERVYAYSGAQPGELDGGRWTSIVHPEDIPAAGSNWLTAIASGSVYEVEFRLRQANGEYRWHLARALPIFDDNKAIIRWVGTNTDIDDQKNAAATLSRLNEMLEQQVSQRTRERDRMWRLSNDLMLVADFGATIVAVNPAFSSLLGWVETDLIGKQFLDLVHPDDLQSTLGEVGKLEQGVTTFAFENRYRHSDDSYRLIAWSAAPDKEFIHAVGRDITAEREAEEAMKRTEKALQQAQKMETIGKLTGGVAHDFNNLLQVISGNLQLLASDVGMNPVAARRVENAMGGVARGAKLASHLLAFGRRQPLEPKVVKISKYIAAMEDMLHRTLGEEIEVEMVISAGLWNTSVDTVQVENAVLNLCINARDAMDGAGKLTLEVGNAHLDDAYASAHPELKPGQYVMIGVSDTGTGMTPEVMAQAFEPFFSTKPEGKGTGLGLSMVYGFVKQSGGHVAIYSELGHGTTIKLYLPRSFETEDEVAVTDAVAISGGTETILVAEDDEGVRTTVVEMLRDLGYSVLKASDAASALVIIESGVPIDLLFTDVVMPGPLRSPDLARKARERLPNLGVLFTSGYTENAIVHGGRLDAGVELLGKPYTKEALSRKIRHVLANQQQRKRIAPASHVIAESA